LVFFTIDLTSPIVSVLLLENIIFDRRDIPLNLAVDEPTSRIAYSLDGKENVSIGGNTTLAGLADGKHNITAYAWDLAGNIGTSKTVFFTVKVPFLTTLVIASVIIVAVVGIGLFVYFKKR
jgi:hypothetical protein